MGAQGVAKKRMNVVLDDDLINELHGAAKSECESMSLIVRNALRDHLRKLSTGASR